jgi:iron complex transport system substrate-binding protein
MAGGNWMPELVALAGGENLFGEKGKHSPWMSAAELREQDPDIVLFLPCGFPIERTEAELGTMLASAEWRNLRAVKEGSCFVVDGNQYFNRPGPRLVDSLLILCEIFHPSAFPPRFRGSGWRPAALPPAG